MADRLRVGKPSRCVTSHLGQVVNSAFHPSGVGKSSTIVHLIERKFDESILGKCKWVNGTDAFGGIRIPYNYVWFCWLCSI